MSRAQASTVIKVVGAGIAAILTLAGYYLYLEHGTLANDIEADHITAALGAFLRAEPWAAVGIVVLVVGALAFAIGLLTGHIGEAAKVEPSGNPGQLPRLGERCAYCGRIAAMPVPGDQVWQGATCGGCGAWLKGDPR